MKIPRGRCGRDCDPVDEGTSGGRQWIGDADDLQNEGVHLDGGLLEDPAGNDLPGKCLVYRPITVRFQASESEGDASQEKGGKLTEKRTDPKLLREQSLQFRQ